MIDAVRKAAGRVPTVIRLPSADEPEVSLIVLLDGAPEMCERCLRAIAAAEGAVPFETLVLLNDPEPELEEMVRGSTSGGRVIVPRANAGPGVGWNLGAAVARAPRLATLHEDAEPEPDWLAALCAAMDETGAGAVGSRLLNGDGSIQNCGWALFSDGSVQQIREASAPELVDRRPRSALTGRPLREFLYLRNRNLFLAKWGASMRDLAPPPPDLSPESVRPAVEAALVKTRERAERVRSGNWPADRARTADPRFTGIADPALVNQGDRFHEVVPEINEALNRAESDLVDEYCRWLVPREEQTRRQFEDLFDRRLRELDELHHRIEDLRQDNQQLNEANQELGKTLNAILQGRTWRLRTRLAKLLRRG